ncbi:MAG TPA: hypothetical protein DCE43_20300, partial [Planctomycetaceae bacterium]|nr:hypothetical protein [Planctomycetaceae bacterium]
MQRICFWRRLFVQLAAVVLLVMVNLPAEAADRAAELQRFEAKIRPLLVSRCSKCHSGPKAKAGLDLSRVTGLMNGGRSGPVVVPGNPTGS